jgi:hypothetical protein
VNSSKVEVELTNSIDVVGLYLFNRRESAPVGLLKTGQHTCAGSEVVFMKVNEVEFLNS